MYEQRLGIGYTDSEAFGCSSRRLYEQHKTNSKVLRILPELFEVCATVADNSDDVVVYQCTEIQGP